MINIDQSKIRLSFILEEIANQLDISETLYKEAVDRYEAVGKWLGEGDSPLADFSPVIYPQGSFLLGTVTKRWGKDDEYDIDLVFEINLSKYKISQETLKNMIGDRIKENEVYRRMLDKEGRRCWTLVYANDAKFHLDILPAIPDVEFRATLKSLGIPENWANTSIDITDNTLPNYARIDPDWPRCNPKGYAAWFHSRMIIQYEAAREIIAEAMKAEIEDVPAYKVKTPLQQCIQLMKRHRDILFEDKDDKPSTIITTTLGALAYNNEVDLYEALTNIVRDMLGFISPRNGILWVQNPVDPEENFADRWQDPEHPNRKKDFYAWHQRLQSDLQALLECDDIDRVSELLSSMFGEKATVPAIRKYKDEVRWRANIVISPSTSNRQNQPWGY